MHLTFYLLVTFLAAFPATTATRKHNHSKRIDGEKTLKRGGAKYEKLPHSKLIHMSYIAKPGLVRILCRSVKLGFYDMKISCPTLDGDRNNTITPFLLNKSIMTQHVKRTIHPKATSRRIRFLCFCRGRPAYGPIFNASITIEVQKSWKKRVVPFRRKTDARKSIHLRCHLTGGPTLYVSWYKSRRKISLGHDARRWNGGINYKVKKHNLKFRIADTRASGNYTCFARNMAGHEWGKRYDVILFNDDGCLSHTCRSNATCTRNNGTFSCLCKSGFKGNEVHCTDIDECLSNPCYRNEICVNEIGSFSCKTKNKTGNSSKHKHKKEYMWKVGLGAGITLLVFILIMIWWKCKKPKTRRASIMDSDNSLRDSSVFQDNNPPANSTSVPPPFNATMSPRVWTQYVGAGIRCSHSEPHLHRNDSPLTFTRNDPALFNLEHRAIMSTSSCSTDISSTVTTPFAAVLPKNANERHYISATIDHRGGELILNNARAKLIIPQGALPNGATKEIYITFMENDNDRPHLEPHLSLISPVIMCGPHGLKFEKPVMLIFPHCAAIQKGIRGFQILCSNTNEYQDTKWETIFDADKKPSEECFCSYDDNMCYLSVLHFTKFAAVCRCKAKMMNFLAYTTKSNIPDDFCQIRTYCFPNSEVCRKKIQDEEYSVHGTRCDAVRSLLLMENGKGFQYTIKDIEEGWKNLYEASQTIDHVEIWNSMFPVSRTFTLKRTDSKSKKKKFSCRIEVMQKDGEEAKIRTIHVAYHLPMFRASSSSSSSSGASSSGYATSRSGEEARESSFKESCRFPTELRVKLAHMLDGERMVDGKDWRLVAEKLKVGNDFIKWLTRNKRIDSPILYILRFYENIPNSGSTETKLRKLAKILDDIGREDASKAIKDYLENKSPQRKETITTESEVPLLSHYYI